MKKSKRHAVLLFLAYATIILIVGIIMLISCTTKFTNSTNNVFADGEEALPTCGSCGAWNRSTQSFASNAQWSYDSATKTLVIFGSGATFDCYVDWSVEPALAFVDGYHDEQTDEYVVIRAPWFDLDIENVIVESGIGSIGTGVLVFGGSSNVDIYLNSADITIVAGLGGGEVYGLAFACHIDENTGDPMYCGADMVNLHVPAQNYDTLSENLLACIYECVHLEGHVSIDSNFESMPDVANIYAGSDEDVESTGVALNISIVVTSVVLLGAVLVVLNKKKEQL